LLIFNYGHDHRLQAEFENIKEVIKIRKSKKDRQHNDQNKMDKRTINDLQNTTQNNKDRATRTQLKIGGELGCSGRVGSFCSISDTSRVNEQYLKILRTIRGEIQWAFICYYGRFNFGL
jgi:hypothetical protein